jgi:RNA polymerase sigma factor (sigma-70 family)
VETWAYSIAMNTIKDFRRKNHRARRRDEIIRNNHFWAEQRSAKSLICDDIAESLSGPEKKLFLLYLEDVGFREISEETGIAEATLRKRVSKIKEQIKANYNGR